MVGLLVAVGVKVHVGLIATMVCKGLCKLGAEGDFVVQAMLK